MILLRRNQAGRNEQVENAGDEQRTPPGTSHPSGASSRLLGKTNESNQSLESEESENTPPLPRNRPPARSLKQALSMYFPFGIERLTIDFCDREGNNHTMVEDENVKYFNRNESRSAGELPPPPSTSECENFASIRPIRTLPRNNKRITWHENALNPFEGLTGNGGDQWETIGLTTFGGFKLSPFVKSL